MTWENFRRALYSDRNNPTILYRPTVCLTFALNHYFGGLNVFGYHLINVLIHVLSSVFLFLFIYHTLNLPSIKTRYAADSYFLALLATTLWAINPVHTQAVTNIVQRMASLAGMFYIMSMYFYLKARTTDIDRKRVLFFITCFIFFIMALGSKENAAMLPLSIFLYEILLMQEMRGEKLRKYLKLFGMVAGVVLVFCFTYFYVQGGNIFSFLIGYENRPFTLGQRLLTEPLVVVFYITLLLYPVPNRLSIDQPLPFGIPESMSGATWAFFCILSILLVAGSIIYAIYSAKRRPLFSFCILFFFVNHAIESTILPLELIFEHRNYIPSMLIFLPIAIGFVNLLRLYAKKPVMKHIISAFIILLLIGLGHATFMRNFAWINDETLWADAVEKAPNHYRPHHNLGRYYQDQGYKSKAISEYHEALESSFLHRKNEEFVTYYNLGKIYAELRDYEKALSFFNIALRMAPDFPPVHNDIAVVFDSKGNYQRAHRYFLNAIALEPDRLETNYNLGLFYLRDGQPDKAIYHLDRVPNGSPFEQSILLYRGIAFKHKGRLGRALSLFKRAVEKDPRNIRPYLHLAEIFFLTGDKTRAQGQVAKAISLISDTKAFKKILEALLTKGRSRNLQPNADVVIPLMMNACRAKSQIFQEWSDLLKEKSFELKREQAGKDRIAAQHREEPLHTNSSR